MPRRKGPALSHLKVGRPAAIDPQFSQALQDMIQEKIDKAEGKEKEELQKKSFIAYKSVGGRDRVGLSFPHFAYVANSMQIPIVEVFDRAGEPLEWPNEKAKMLDDALRCLDDMSKARLAVVIRSMSPEFWQPDQDASKLIMTSPTKRLYYAVRNSYTNPPEQGQMVKEWGNEAFIRVWNNRKLDTMAPVKDILEVNKITGFSPAWLLAWVDGKTTVLADSPVSEYIIAGYFFMSKENQKVFDLLLISLLKELEGAE